ncbi:hypothetical protein B9Z19DRAFT_1060546 [Tuber borchii]|uniref:Uncharacterized protein n=1 Tax=Tuber borchii TaxID=42251 RepID=A0A2T7A8A4_TUBBO|nr:hypothetical protein B9Z19DRAFT_1060546 [Tuber borchii]
MTSEGCRYSRTAQLKRMGRKKSKESLFRETTPGRIGRIGSIFPALLYSATVAPGDQTGKQEFARKAKRFSPELSPSVKFHGAGVKWATLLPWQPPKSLTNCCQLSGKQQTAQFKVLSGVDNG